MSNPYCVPHPYCGRPAWPRSARGDPDPHPQPAQSHPALSDLDLDSPSRPTAGRVPRRGRGAPRARKRGCRGGQRWRACSRPVDVISVTSINATSLNKPKGLQLLHHLHDTRVEVCLVQETWFNPAVPARFKSVPGYKLLHEDRVGKLGGGVAILVRDTLESYRFPQQQVVNTESKLETVGPCQCRP